METAFLKLLNGGTQSAKGSLQGFPCEVGYLSIVYKSSDGEINSEKDCAIGLLFHSKHSLLVACCTAAGMQVSFPHVICHRPLAQSELFTLPHQFLQDS